MDKNKLLLLGFLCLMLVAIPLTLLFVKEQQNLQSSAAPSSSLSLVSNKDTANVGDEITIDVILDPGKNVPSYIQFTLKYDPEKLQVLEITRDQENTTTELSPPKISSDSATAEFGINKILTGYDPASNISTPFSIARLKAKALAPTTTSGPTRISFEFPGNTLVASIASEDGPRENVLVSTMPVEITILDGDPAVTPSITASPSPTPSISLSPTPIASATPTPTIIPNTPPVCTNLTVTPATGSAPLTISIIAYGNDADGQIEKGTFNFGDGQVIDLTEGLSTKTATLQQSHTYTAAGNPNLSVIFTDDKGDTSQACSQTIIVQESTSNDNTAVPTQALSPTPIPTVAAPGSFGTTVGMVGAIILTIVGGVVLFIL